MGIAGIAAGSRKSKERRKKPDELLSSVVRETAVPAAVALLKSNQKFVFPSGTAWVMLGLSSEAVGGLNRRQGRDEAKGSIIKLIESDQIETVATAEMLAEEVFGIIPTPDTLARMDEYSLLSSAEYWWAVAWQKGDGDLHVEFVVEATYAQASQVSAGTLGLEQAVGKQAWADHSGVAAADPFQVDNTGEKPETEQIDMIQETAEQTEANEDLGDEIFDDLPETGETVTDSEAEVEEEEPVFSDVGDDEDEPVFADETPEPVAETGVEPEDDEDVIDEFDGEDQVYEDVAVDDTGEEVYTEVPDGIYSADQDEARAVIARRFLSEDLDLGIRLDEFNATFAIGAPAVRIDIPEGASEWLGDQIAQLNRQANADMAGLRYQHEDELRALYVNLMGTHIEQVIRAVAPDREGSRYKELMAGIEREKAKRTEGKDDEIRAAKAEIVAAHDQHAKLLAEKAARDAEAHYKERNRTRIEREQADAGVEIERRIEADHSHQLTEILRIRRNDAGLKLQVGQTEIFKVLTEKHKENLDAEQARLDQWKVEIQRIVEDNRSNDVARANALAEQLARTDDLGAARAEHEKALAAQRMEFEDRTRRMEDELKRSREDALVKLNEHESEWGRDLAVEKERTDLLRRQLAEQREENQNIEGDVKRRYEGELADLRKDREAFVQEVERASVMQGYSSKLIIALMIGLPLFVGIACFLLGLAF